MRVCRRSLRRSAALAFVLLTGTLCATSRAQTSGEQLAGLWLIEAPYFDPFVENGMDLPTFPVLSIKGDGSFRLFRIRPSCEPIDETGRDIFFTEQPARALAECKRYLTLAMRDGIATSSMPSAAGKWQAANDGRIRFAADSKERPAIWFMQMLRDFRAAMTDGKLDYIDRVKHGEDMAALQRRLNAQAHRIETFYSTFYVFDGESVTFALGDQTLSLTGLWRATRWCFDASRPACWRPL